MLDPSLVRTLVSRARGGDVDAFEQLARGHAAAVYRVAVQIVGNPEDAQDVAQRALLSAWQNLDGFRGDSAFGTWLHQITRRHALNTVTRRARNVDPLIDVDIADPGSDPAEVASAHDETARVRAAVAGLPDRERRVVNLFHFQRLSYAQIACATNASEPSVRSRLFRARRSLAHTLADHG